MAVACKNRFVTTNKEGYHIMDKKEVLKKGPGREIDFLVAQKVMGQRFHSSVNGVRSEMSLKNNGEIPHYSTDTYFAEKVLEKAREKYQIVLYGATLWECNVFFPTGAVISSGLTESFSLAICRAALFTTIEEENQSKIRQHKQLGNKKKIKLFLTRGHKYAGGR